MEIFRFNREWLRAISNRHGAIYLVQGKKITQQVHLLAVPVPKPVIDTASAILDGCSCRLLGDKLGAAPDEGSHQKFSVGSGFREA